MICDSHGNPLDFVLTQGQVHDCTQSSILQVLGSVDFPLKGSSLPEPAISDPAAVMVTVAFWGDAFKIRYT